MRLHTVALLALGLLFASGCSEPEEEPVAPTPDPPLRAWSDGPYGTAVMDTVDSFTVPTRDGDWTLSEHWDGTHSYVFFRLKPSSSYTSQVWGSSLQDLLTESDPSVHYFFVVDDDNWQGSVYDMEDRVDALLDELEGSEADHWRQRLHVVHAEVNALGSPVEDILETWHTSWDWDIAGFAIDRLQRLRQLGYMRWPSGDGGGEMKYAGLSTRLFAFESDREVALAQEDATVLTLVESGSSGVHEIELPPTEELLTYDRLSIDYGMECTDRSDANCPDWDRITSLHVCAPGDLEACSTEVARWITTYKREGRWVVDATPALAHLTEGGLRGFRVDGPGGNQYTVRLRFSRSGDVAGRPSEAVALWTGGGFNESYNENHAPITFTVPDDVVKVELYAIISGHGWGIEEANCAEFCNHVHHFELNGSEWIKDHLQDLGNTGCMDKAQLGVIPAQYGTWPLGRAGWCPGWEVPPFVEDLTDAVQPGENTLDYYALYGNQEYVPQPAIFPNNSGFAAQINMNSWLVYWR